MKTEFESKLKSKGYSYNINHEGYYKISPIKRLSLPMKVQLVKSKPIKEIIHGSQNGNEIDAIGYFRFKLATDEKPDIIIFEFKHLRDGSSVYMIIPEETLRKRLEKNIIRSRSNEYFELRLWLMDDHLYDTTNLGLEGEWYYLSDRKGGRMIEPTIWNYTSFLNNWILDSRG
jgi:hypothetical protein